MLLRWKKIPEKNELAVQYKWSKKDTFFDTKKIDPKYLFHSTPPMVHKLSNVPHFDKTEMKAKKIGVYGSKSSGVHSFISCLVSHLHVDDIRQSKIGNLIETTGQTGKSDPLFSLKVVKLQKNFSDQIEKVLQKFDSIIFVYSLEDRERDENLFTSLRVLNRHLSKSVSSCKIYIVANKLDKLSKDLDNKNLILPLQDNRSIYSISQNSFPVSVLHQINLDYFFALLFDNLFDTRTNK